MESRRRAEQLTVRVRWAILLAACVMMEGRVPLALIGLVGAAAAVYNGLVWRACRTADAYHKTGHKLGHAARWVDLGVITLTLVVSNGTATSTYLLYLVVLVQAGYVDVRRRTLVLMSGAAALTYVGVSIVQRPDLGLSLQLLGRTALIGLGGAVGTYIGASRRQDDFVKNREHRLAALFDWCMRSTSGDQLTKVLSHILRAAVQEVGATSGYVMLVARDNPELLLTEVAYSKQAGFDFPKSCRVGEGLPGYVASSGQPLLLNEGEADEAPWEAEEAEEGVGSAICVPLLNRLGAVDPATRKQHEVMGVVTMVVTEQGTSFTEEDLNLVRMLAALVSMATANARMYEEMRDTFLRTLESLAKSLEARDEYTRGHSQRVCDLSLQIAQEMGVCEEAVEEMRVGTLLHDIGKIGIPDAVLNKPGRLTAEEFELMKQHPVIGWGICRPLGLNEGALMLIRNHHERLDGTGYPDGLKGGELPLSVRIVCVADAFDAMSSRRPYREVMDEKLRLEQFNRFAGSQFDPVVVQVLKTLLRDGRLDKMYREHWSDIRVERDDQDEPPQLRVA